jgi:hypothetical protein
MQESPAPTHFCVLAIPQQVGEHLRGPFPGIDAGASQTLSILTFNSQPVLLSPAQTPAA